MIPEIEDLAPPDMLTQIAWRDCLSWAITESTLMDAFLRDTGIKVRAAKNPLDAMIDEATGAHKKMAIEFVKWFNANVWGIGKDGKAMGAADARDASAEDD